MAASVVQEPAGRACECWAGVACSLFIPGSQLTHEVMVVTLSGGSAERIPFVLRRSFTDPSKSVGDGERWYAAMCWSRALVFTFAPLL